jgi:hypothetical protein
MPAIELISATQSCREGQSCVGDKVANEMGKKIGELTAPNRFVNWFSS